MNEYQSHILSNGIRIVHQPLNNHVSYCGFIVNTGTRDEISKEFGMAHFIEHMLFKGTKKRKAHHIINRMENVGGEINAYTNKEETVIYSVFLEEHFDRAFELLTDLMFHSTFPQKEIEKEIEVILDEINSYEDSPSELIYDEFENIVFRDSQLGHNILGYPETLQTFDTQKAKKFVNQHYTTDNIVFFSLGKTDIKKIIKLAEKYLSDINFQISNYKRQQTQIGKPSFFKLEKETTQSHTVIGGACYDLYHTDRRTLLLLNNILGGPGMNSRLNVSLREKKGYVYNVESNVTNYSDSGLFSIYFGCDKKNTDKCIGLIEKELKYLCEQKLSATQLSAAKKQFIGQIGVSSDNHENLSLNLGKSFLHYNHINNISEITKQIESIKSIDLLNVANEILDKNNLFRLIYS